jgi:hypothetical protein
MSRTKKSKNKSIVRSLFNRRDGDRPADDADIVSTLEEISRQVHKEATEALITREEFFAPTHVLKPVAPAPRKEKAARGYHLTPDQYEKMIESSLTVLEQAGQIIDRNRAATAMLKKALA